MRRYAQETSVPVEKSRIEIERVLVRYGAKSFGTMTEPDKATIYFKLKGRELQWSIPMPTGKEFPKEAKRDQETRRRWRVMLITMKAMIESVESGLLTFDEAFLAHIVIPGHAETIGSMLVPRLDALYGGLSLPALLAENPRG
jgi:hypothetical protein